MAVKTVKAQVNMDGGITIQVWADKKGMTQERAEMAAQMAFETVCSKGLRGASFHRPEKEPHGGPHFRAVWKFLADGKTIIKPKGFKERFGSSETCVCLVPVPEPDGRCDRCGGLVDLEKLRGGQNGRS